MSRDAASPAPGPTTADWEREAAVRWELVADRLEAQLEPVSDLLFERARLAPGERVLDVGCGRGSTTRGAAEAVAPDGRVAGLDVAANLIATAREIPARGAPIEWVVTDAQRAELPAGGFDVLISRFGTLFFDDAVAAFSNLAHAITSGGRLCMAVWQRRDRSDLLQRPLEIAAETAGRLGFAVPLADPAAGPFALGVNAEETLTAAGWSDVRIDARDIAMYSGGPGTVEEAVDVALAFGSSRNAVAEAPDEVVDAVREALTADFASRHDGTGVRMTGAVVIVTARR